jgi:hypothetical protein
MIWKDLQPYDDPQVSFKQDLFDWYQRLIAIRRAIPALQLGFAHTVLADDATGVFAFSRDLNSSHVCVIVNRSDQDRTEQLMYGPPNRDGYFINWLDPADARMGEIDGRPSIAPLGDAAPAAVSRNGKLEVKLKPWSSMVLSGY